MIVHSSESVLRWRRRLLNVVRVTQSHADARVQDILRAGAKVFAERGSEGATMQGIAREAGVSAGTLYLYFPNKSELLRAVCSMKHEGINQILSLDARDGETPLESFGRIARQMGDAFGQPDLREQTICSLEAVLLAARDPEGFGIEQRAINAEVTAAIEGLMSAAQDTGELDPQVDAHDLAIVLHACALGLRELQLNSPDVVDSHRAFEMLGRLVLGLSDRQLATGDRQQRLADS
jgi:AcrR family transcriptional regulator